MTISLDEKVAIKNGLTFDEVLLSLLISRGVDINSVKASLLLGTHIVESEGQILITHGLKDRLERIILDSEKDKEPEERFIALAKAMMTKFPKGKKEDTIYYWKGNTSEIVTKLKSFFKKYGNDFTDEQIIDATTKYVESFNGQYRNMRLLKYFISKNLVSDGETERVSELLSYLENAGEEIEVRDNWTSSLR